MQFQAEQVGLDGTIRKTLDKHRGKCVFMDRVGRDTTRNGSYVLGVSVHITLALLEFQEI